MRRNVYISLRIGNKLLPKWNIEFIKSYRILLPENAKRNVYRRIGKKVDVEEKS